MGELIRNAEGKSLGVYHEEQNVLYKRVKASQHLFRKLDAWGVDEAFVRDTLKPGGKIILYSSEEEKEYSATRETLLEKAKYLHFAGHGLQLFLPRSEWSIIEKTL